MLTLFHIGINVCEGIEDTSLPHWQSPTALLKAENSIEGVKWDRS
jgi:hypothetical protein